MGISQWMPLYKGLISFNHKAIWNSAVFVAIQIQVMERRSGQKQRRLSHQKNAKVNLRGLDSG